MRIRFSFLAFCFVGSLLGPKSLHAESCDAILSQSKYFAETLKVSLGRSPVKVGEKLNVNWQSDVTKFPTTSDLATKAFVVFRTNSPVRFAGTGYFALTPNAEAPFNLRSGMRDSRIFYSPNFFQGASRQHEFTIIPFRRERLTLTWAVVINTPCGEHVFGEKSRSVEVYNGDPEIVIQNVFSTERPARRIASLNGQYELLASSDRYEVLDASNGARILEIAGADPNFSPASRFVVSRRTTDDLYEVYDLVSRGRIAELPYGLLAWLRNDSYFINGGSDWGSVTIQNAIVDSEPILATTTGCHACSAWEVAQIVADFNRGFFAVFADDLNGSSAVAPVVVGEKARSWDGSKHREAALTFIRSRFASADYQIPKTWDLGEKIVLSQATDDKTQLRFLVKHRSTEAKFVLNTAATDVELIGRTLERETLTRRPISKLLPTVQLQSLGLPLLDRIDVEHVFKQTDGDKRGFENAILATAINRIKLSAPPSIALFREPEIGSDDKLLSPLHITDIWRWDQNGIDNWIVQTIRVEGSAGVHYSDLFLIMAGPAAKVSLLKIDIGGASRYSSFFDALRIQPFVLSSSVVVIGLSESQRIAVLDLTKDQIVDRVINTSNVELLADIRLLEDRLRLLRVDRNGSLSVLDISNGSLLLRGAIVDDEVVIVDARGAYDTTYEGASSVQIRFPGMPGLYNFKQFEKALYRNGLASSILKGATVASDVGSLNPPPVVNLVLSASKNGERTARVFSSSANALSEFRIYVDGRLESSAKLTGVQKGVEFRMKDPGAGRYVSAVATDINGLLSLPSVVKIPGLVEPKGTLRALTIGVDHYADSNIVTLQYAKSDAVNLANALSAHAKSSFQNLEVRSLTDDAVTPEGVLAIAKGFADSTGPNDTLVVAFAGHAIGGNSIGRSEIGLMLATSNSSLKRLPETSLKWSDLQEATSASRGKVLFFLDACHSGLAGSEKFGTNDDVVTSLFTKSGSSMIVLAASKGRQLSLEDPVVGGGLFTSAIIDVIGRDRKKFDTDQSGLIDLSELYRGVKDKVLQASQGKQTPWLARSGIVGEVSLF